MLRNFNCAAAGDRTRVTRVTGGNTYHYTTTTFKDPTYEIAAQSCIIYIIVKFGSRLFSVFFLPVFRISGCTDEFFGKFQQKYKRIQECTRKWKS